MNKNFLLWIIILLATLMIFNNFNKQKTDLEIETSDLTMSLQKSTLGRGKIVNITLKNNTALPITIPNDCPGEPLDVYFYQNGEWSKRSGETPLDCAEIGWGKDFTLEAGKSIKVNYDYWNYQMFHELGRYQIKVQTIINGEKKSFSSSELTIEKESFLTSSWRNFFYRPIYNVLIAFAKILPGHSLGLAIILLTILIRSILLIPSQKAMRAQKKLQEIQPKLEHIKKKHKNDQQRIAQETMAIWKEHKVNPFGSCLPILIQFPVMIAVFYVVRNGINPDSIYLLYEPLKNFSLFSINTNFLGILDLTKINILPLPIIIGGLQFYQMKLTMARKKAKKETSNKPAKKKKNDVMPDMEVVNKSMAYFLPVMIAFFTASVPAGVGLYWGISTIFGIGQQFVINREVEKEKPQVKVV